MKWLYLIFILAVCTNPAFPQDNLVPEFLPEDFDTPNRRLALEHWADKAIHPINKKIIKSVQYENQSWFQVYFKMDVILHLPQDEASLKKLYGSLRSTLKAFNAAGFYLHIAFAADVTIRANNENPFHAERMGKFLDQNITTSLKPLIIHVLDPKDPLWKENSRVDELGNGHAAILDDYSTVYISAGAPLELIHELNHILLGSNDAYRYSSFWDRCMGYGVSEEDAEYLEFLNASSKTTDIDPIEIYIGLTAAGLDLQSAWDHYVYYFNNREYVAQIDQGKSLRILTSRIYAKGALYLRIYDVYGKEVFNSLYVTPETRKQEEVIRIHQKSFSQVQDLTYLPDFVSLDFLPVGSYVVDIKLLRIHDENVPQFDKAFEKIFRIVLF